MEELGGPNTVAPRSTLKGQGGTGKVVLHLDRGVTVVASTGEQPDIGWVLVDDRMDWDALSELYRVAPLGEKPPESLRTVFSNSMFKCFLYSDGRLIGAGRAIADGLDCAYVADVAVHPDFQGRGLGKAIISRLVEMAKGHRKIILYANPGTEGFYLGLGFLPMATAMAVWDNQERAIELGLLRSTDSTDIIEG